MLTDTLFLLCAFTLGGAIIVRSAIWVTKINDMETKLELLDEVSQAVTSCITSHLLSTMLVVIVAIVKEQTAISHPYV